MLLCGAAMLLLASAVVAYKRRSRLKPLEARFWSPRGRRLSESAEEAADDSAEDALTRPATAGGVSRRARPHDKEPIFQGPDSSGAER